MATTVSLNSLSGAERVQVDRVMESDNKAGALQEWLANGCQDSSWCQRPDAEVLMQALFQGVQDKALILQTKDCNGFTALHRAAQNNDSAMAGLILKVAGKRHRQELLLTTDHKGLIPLFHAAKEDHREVQKLLHLSARRVKNDSQISRFVKFQCELSTYFYALGQCGLNKDDSREKISAVVEKSPVLASAAHRLCKQVYWRTLGPWQGAFAPAVDTNIEPLNKCDMPTKVLFEGYFAKRHMQSLQIVFRNEKSDNTKLSLLWGRVEDISLLKRCAGRDSITKVRDLFKLSGPLQWELISIVDPSALLRAVSVGNINMVKEMLTAASPDKNVLLNTVYSDGLTIGQIALKIAAKKGHADIAELLLKQCDRGLLDSRSPYCLTAGLSDKEREHIQGVLERNMPKC